MDRFTHRPPAVVALRASVMIIALLGAAEQVRYARRRLDRRVHRTWEDVEHSVWKRLLRRALDVVAAELIPLAAEARYGRRA